MSPNPANLMVATLDDQIVIKVCGRANLGLSPEFKHLFNTLIEEGRHQIAIDFRECPIMDSTFSGVLAGMGQRLSESSSSKCPIHLISPNEKIVDLLQSLGVEEFFTVHQGNGLPHADAFKPASEVAPPASRVEIAETCLEAHRKLVELNSANAAKFKDVTTFLEQDLKRLKQGGT